MDFFFQVIMQLEACGIVETIHISAAGFPIRSTLFWDCHFLLSLLYLFFVIYLSIQHLVKLYFLFCRIAFKAFLQRYGLIAKHSNFESGTIRPGKHCIIWALVSHFNLAKRPVFDLMVSSFLSLAYFINSTLNSIVFLGLFHLVYKYKT